MTTQEKTKKSELRIAVSEDIKNRFNEMKKDFSDNSEFIQSLLNAYEQVKNEAPVIPDNAIVLSDTPKQFFEGSRQREKELRQSVMENFNLKSLEMTENEFLNLASEVSGQTKEEIVSKGLQSYGQSLISKIANGSSTGLGSKDREISEIVNTLCTMILSGQLPQFEKLTVTKISQFSGKNYDTVKGWAKRQGVYEMIKDTNNCVTTQNMNDFLAKLK